MTDSTQTQLRSGTTSQVNSMTPALAEVVVDNTLSQLCIGDGSTPGGIKTPNAKMIQNQNFTYPSVGGSANAIILTNTPEKAALVAGQRGTFMATADCSGAVTIDEDGLGVKDAKKINSGAIVALADGDLINGGMYDYLWDGTQYQIKALAEGPFKSGTVFLGSATASNSSTIDLTSLLSPTYDNYVIVLENILPATNNTTLQMRLSSDNSTFDTGSTSYSYANKYIDSGAAETTLAGDLVNTTKIASPVDSTAKNGVSGRINLYNVNSTGYHTWDGRVTFHGGPNGTINGSIGGRWKPAADSAIEAVRFYMLSGNITSGIFNVFGLSKS